MSAPDFSLLAKRRFGPMFVVQFIGAFNDNALKYAMLFLVTFTLYKGDENGAASLAALATGLFILPYFLFSALAGQIADGWDKAKLMRIVKAAEIVFMALGLAGLALQSVPLLLAVLFLMGCHSTIFGPVKYSILPQHLGPDEIMGGTGMIEAGTFLAILGGQLMPNFIPPWEAGLLATGMAVLGFLASLAIPPAPPAPGVVRVERNVFRSTWHVLKSARDAHNAWLCILGISWFFAVGAVLLNDFAPLVTNRLGAGKPVVTLFLLVFSISIAIGSLAVNRLLKGRVSARYVPLAALLMAGFLIDLWPATRGFVVTAPGADIARFVAAPGSWRILIDLAGLAFAGGMFIVPLYALLQTNSPVAERSRIIAANNIVNSLVIVLVMAVVIAMAKYGASISAVIATLGFSTLVVALGSCWLLPETMIKRLIRRALGRTAPSPPQDQDIA